MLDYIISSTFHAQSVVEFDENDDELIPSSEPEENDENELTGRLKSSARHSADELFVAGQLVALSPP
jgi:hypothetical protein